jgi:hypothetical protein
MAGKDNKVRPIMSWRMAGNLRKGVPNLLPLSMNRH